MLKQEIKWLGIPQDEKNFVFQEHPEDLFTSAEINILDKEGEEFYDELALEEYEE